MWGGVCSVLGAKVGDIFLPADKFKIRFANTMMHNAHTLTLIFEVGYSRMGMKKNEKVNWSIKQGRYLLTEARIFLILIDIFQMFHFTQLAYSYIFENLIPPKLDVMFLSKVVIFKKRAVN